MRNQPALFILALALASIFTLAEAKIETTAIPTDAQVIIKKVRSAAQNREFEKLRGLMEQGFLWNFGPDGSGDDSSERAIAEWRKDGRYLRELTNVLKSSCRLHDETTVNCPGKGGMNFRAIFSKTDEGWRMRAFVEGD